MASVALGVFWFVGIMILVRSIWIEINRRDNE